MREIILNLSLQVCKFFKLYVMGFVEDSAHASLLVTADFQSVL